MPGDVPLPGENAPIVKYLYRTQSAAMFTVGVSVAGAFAPELALVGLIVVAGGEEIGLARATADRP
jgi:hypothetical protein